MEKNEQTTQNAEQIDMETGEITQNVEQLDVDIAEIEQEGKEALRTIADINSAPTAIRRENEVKELAKTPENDKREIIPLVKGVPSPGTIDAFYRECTALYDPSLMPPEIKNVKQFFAIALFGSRYGLNPLQAVAGVSSVKGRLALHSDAPLSIVYASGELEHIEEHYFDKDGNKLELDPTVNNGNPINIEKIYGAFCKIIRKGFEHNTVVGVYTMKMAKDAGLIRGKGMPWDNHPNIMLKRRARAFALKDRFPDILSGMKIREYDDLEYRSPKDVTPINTDLQDQLMSREVGNTTEPIEENTNV